jgi:hypothetical protein
VLASLPEVILSTATRALRNGFLAEAAVRFAFLALAAGFAFFFFAGFFFAITPTSPAVAAFEWFLDALD